MRKMTKEKQIEEMQEMANILTEASHMACEDIPLLPTDMTICDKIPCHRCKETRLLSYNGYRKASDVVDEIKKYILEGAATIESHNSDALYGAKFAIENVVLPILEAFKKKYTEGGE